jgi:hypothetical protein
MQPRAYPNDLCDISRLHACDCTPIRGYLRPRNFP